MKRFLIFISLAASFLVGCSAQSQPKTPYDEAKENILYAQETFDIPDEYVEHGNVELLKREVAVDSDSIIKRIIAEYVSL